MGGVCLLDMGQAIVHRGVDVHGPGYLFEQRFPFGLVLRVVTLGAQSVHDGANAKYSFDRLELRPVSSAPDVDLGPEEDNGLRSQAILCVTECVPPTASLHLLADVRKGQESVTEKGAHDTNYLRSDVNEKAICSGLSVVPDELIRCALSYLCVRDLAVMIAVSLRFAHIAREESLWAPFADLLRTRPELRELEVAYFGGSIRCIITCYKSSHVIAGTTARINPPCISVDDISITVRVFAGSQLQGQISIPPSALPMGHDSENVLSFEVDKFKWDQGAILWSVEVYAANLRTGRACCR
jgi:hypothetical protein